MNMFTSYTRGLSFKRSPSSFILAVLMVLLGACGGGGGGSAPSVTPAPSSPAAMRLLAGNMGGSGNVDGSPGAFANPRGIASDSAGNIYVADTDNHLIRKITPAGVVSTLAGSAGSSGSIDGTGAAARFNGPKGVATDSVGNLYVADSLNHLIRKITPTGAVSTMAGSAGNAGADDGTGDAARFDGPQSVATDRENNVYVADTNNQTIRKITPAGDVSTLAGSAGIVGSDDGTGAAASFRSPVSVATDSAGNVYVADSINHTIRKITPVGDVSTLAGSAGNFGSDDGTGAAAGFSFPLGVATDSQGNVYVADSDNQLIRKITPSGVVTTLAGTVGTAGAADGTGSAARFSYAQGIATDSAGNVYLADTNNHTIRKITPAGLVSTLAGAVPTYGATEGIGANARFNVAKGIAADSTGNVYMADTNNHTIRKITPAGLVSTLAGAAGTSGFANGTTAARFNGPQGVAVDGKGNVYVADTDSHTIRKITPAGVVSTLAGSAGSLGSDDGNGASARFQLPQSVAADSAGNVYVADTLNHTIRKITPTGDVSTLAGSAGNFGSADGTGATAQFYYPYGVATDSTGNVYVSDMTNHTIRKITPAGLVSTLAGAAGNSGYADGDGTAARFNNPQGIAADSMGNVYVADPYNEAIRKITPTGVVSTVIGVFGKRGFVAGALPGSIQNVIGVAFSGSTLYLNSDSGVGLVSNVP